MCIYACTYAHMTCCQWPYDTIGYAVIRCDTIRYETIRYDTINLEKIGVVLLVLEYSDRVSALVSYAYVSLSLPLSLYVYPSVSPPFLSSPLILSQLIEFHLISSFSLHCSGSIMAHVLCQAQDQRQLDYVHPCVQ